MEEPNKIDSLRTCIHIVLDKQFTTSGMEIGEFALPFNVGTKFAS
jgi:hypothetical protein